MYIDWAEKNCGFAEALEPNIGEKIKCKIFIKKGERVISPLWQGFNSNPLSGGDVTHTTHFFFLY